MKKYYKDNDGGFWELKEEQVSDVERNLGFRLTEMTEKEWTKQLVETGGI